MEICLSLAPPAACSRCAKAISILAGGDRGRDQRIMGLQALRYLDAFARAEEHLLQKTKSGALVSLIGVAVMAMLFVHELQYYLTTYTVHQMGVDLKRGETLPININMTFPSLPCEVLSLDAIDLSGKHEVDMHTNIWKLRLNKEGRIIGHEYVSDLVAKEHTSHQHDSNHPEKSPRNGKERDPGSEMETIKNIKSSLASGEGCQIFGYLDVQRVAGNFHMSIQAQQVSVADQIFGGPNNVNVSHLIHNLAFGPEYPGIRNPLDGTSRILMDTSGTFKYYIQIVPTEYRYLSKAALPTHQFSVSEYFNPWKESDKTWPAVYFMYDLSPITVTIKEERRSFLHFLTRISAVLGGTFALTGMLDRWTFRLIEAFNGSRTRTILR